MTPWTPGHGWTPHTQEDTDPGASWQPLISFTCWALVPVLTWLVLWIVIRGVVR